jgi:hypothetical protein
MYRVFSRATVQSLRSEPPWQEAGDCLRWDDFRTANLKIKSPPVCVLLIKPRLRHGFGFLLCVVFLSPDGVVYFSSGWCFLWQFGDD